MIGLAIIGMLAVVYRAWRRQLTGAEIAVLSVAAVCALTVVAQQVVAHRILPEMRYWGEASALFYPWGVWGILEFCRGRSRLGIRLLTVTMAAFALVCAAMAAKAHVPGTRRHAYVAACDWAVERIREDWKGPARDPEFAYSGRNYHPPYRPSVWAHTQRVSYLLGGRRYSWHIDREIGDAIDYWVDDVARRRPPCDEDGFEKLNEFACDGYRFELWKRR